MSRVAKNPICKIIWCQEPHYAQGFCKNHYRRWLRKNTPMSGEADSMSEYFSVRLSDLAQRIHRAERHKGSFETCTICSNLKGITHGS